MRDNVRASADHLRHGSRLLEDLVLAGRLAVIPADYELETGRVQFFEGRPDGAEEVQKKVQKELPMEVDLADANGTGPKPRT
jgi:carbonic anhydrase